MDDDSTLPTAPTKYNAMREWLNAYVPGHAVELPAAAQSTDNSLWAADVWYSIKKHWVLELQRQIRAHRAQDHAN